jgi:hypothetical protein
LPGIAVQAPSPASPAVYRAQLLQNWLAPAAPARFGYLATSTVAASFLYPRAKAMGSDSRSSGGPAAMVVVGISEAAHKAIPAFKNSRLDCVTAECSFELICPTKIYLDRSNVNVYLDKGREIQQSHRIDHVLVNLMLDET